jgi:BirA family biotin operon repressor/biotin-[acetyl-CoA-carboxylase] ligase
MDICRAYAEQGAGEGLVVLADAQTAGRGRAGRNWYSPPGQSLYLSILLRPDLPPRRIGWLTMLGALAVADAISQFSILNSQLRLKWPNDVLLNGKKVAGVLVESSLTGDRLDYAVLGIGLNVNTCFDNAPEEVQMRATSLREALGHEVDREVALERLLAAFGTRYATLPASPLADYVRRLDTLGKHVRLQAGDETVEGEALRVEDDGALVVMTNGSERVVTFGDVVGQ